MTRWFFVNGYWPSPHPPQIISSGGYGNTRFNLGKRSTREQRIRSYHEAGIDLPPLGETAFLRKPRTGRISIFVHGAYRAFIMIVAPSQRKAYLLGNGLRSILAGFHGTPPTENPNGYLLELTTKPSQEMSLEDIANLISPPVPGFEYENKLLRKELGTGRGIEHPQIQEACMALDKALDKERLLESLMHLEYSLSLVWGDMTGSYYESHYNWERKQVSRYALERAYLENRFRFDSAFVSAFRGLECVLGKPHFRKHEIPGLLAKTDKKYGTDFCSTKHRSWHELFSSRKKWWSYSDLIAYYLTLRNAVSAHGNPSPPHIVMEDQVFEIHYLLRWMLGSVLINEEGD